MDRYQRNLLIEGFGREGQEKLKSSKVLVVGAGGLGSPVLYYLAASGIGSLGIMDYDVVDLSNLQRQILHNTADLGKNKAISASEKIKALNPELQIQLYREALTDKNADNLIEEYDFVVECCDNYQTKFLINDVCVKQGKPYSHGAVLALQGEVMTYTQGHACYRCVFGEAPEEGSAPHSTQVGILGAVAGVVGSIQATETIKYLSGLGTLLTDRLLIFDGRNMQFQTLRCTKAKACVCSTQQIEQ